MNTSVLDLYLTRVELAEQLGKSHRTLARWEREGTGPPVTKYGNSTRYHVDDVRKWLTAQRKDPLKQKTDR